MLRLLRPTDAPAATDASAAELWTARHRCPPPYTASVPTTDTHVAVRNPAYQRHDGVREVSGETAWAATSAIGFEVGASNSKSKGIVAGAQRLKTLADGRRQAAENHRDDYLRGGCPEPRAGELGARAGEARDRDD